MSEKPKDGGAAFPAIERQQHLDGSTVCHEWGGLTKREWFAGKALQGMVAGLTRFREDHSEIIVNRPTDISELAYLYADAMLAHQEQEKGNAAV